MPCLYLSFYKVFAKILLVTLHVQLSDWPQETRPSNIILTGPSYHLRVHLRVWLMNTNLINLIFLICVSYIGERQEKIMGSEMNRAEVRNASIVHPSPESFVEKQRVKWWAQERGGKKNPKKLRNKMWNRKEQSFTVKLNIQLSYLLGCKISFWQMISSGQVKTVQWYIRIRQLKEVIYILYVKSWVCAGKFYDWFVHSDGAGYLILPWTDWTKSVDFPLMV